ncbi:MAG: hypothetical protein C0594_03940, partial [Marinilabiliales bacterium]
RDYTISPDRRMLGYKLIDENGYQQAALYDLQKDKQLVLNTKSKLCGQPSIGNNGTVCYTVGNDLYVKKSQSQRKFNLGFYANIVVVSPNGSYVSFADNQGALCVLGLDNGNITKVSPPDYQTVYPKWSPDSKKIVYKTTDGLQWVYNIETTHNYQIGPGGSPDWTPDSKFIIYHVESADNFVFHESELYMSDAKGIEQQQLTHTPDVHEMQLSISPGGRILYQTYNQQQIVLAQLDITTKQLVSGTVMVSGSPDVAFFDYSQFYNKQQKSITYLADVPYINQVYDTPDWHNGSGSCAPTTCAMAIAYYNLLPRWPITASSPYSHTSDYGSYVADRYRFNETYYDTYESAYGTDAWGGYGYMWGNGSPNSMQRQYLENHYMQSNQLWTSQCTFENTVTEIDLGYVHPLCVMITSSGHLILARGYVNNQHTLIFNDPYGNKNTPGYPSYDGEMAYYDWPGYNNGYENLDYNGSYGYVPWTTKARAVETTYNDTLIDNNFYDHGFYMNNSGASHQRYFRDGNVGYNGHTWYTMTMASISDVAWVSWTPSLPEAGDYEVLAYIPSNYATAVNALYRVYHEGGVSIVPVNQSTYYDEWVSLGTYTFGQGQTGYVYLGDSTGYDDNMIAYDAVKFSKIPSTLNLSVANVSCHGGSNGAVLAQPSHGIPPYSYVWSNGGTTQQISGIMAGIYGVTVSDSQGANVEGIAEVTEPTELIISANIQNPSSNGGSDGSIQVFVEGGTPDYSYNWSGIGETSDLITGLVADIYTVLVTDNNSCTIMESYELENPSCDMPVNLQASNITSATVELTWDMVAGVDDYELGYKLSSSGAWQNVMVTGNSYYLSGLAADSTYDWRVATICDTSISEYSESVFTTMSLDDYTLTACKGKIYDSGGSTGDYNNDEDYLIQIAPQGATRIWLNFTAFETEATYDFLHIYDGDTTSGTLINSFDGVGYVGYPGAEVVGSGTMTLHFESDYSQVRSGWEAYWIAEGGACGIIPETEIDTSSDWQNSDFVLDFTDHDNTGYGLADAYYQVLDWDGNQWGGNSDLGFFNDNFDQSLNADWTTVLGTWNVSGGSLIQTDEAEINSNIHIPVNFDAADSWMIQFSMKLSGSGTNRRAGLHFACSHPDSVQRWDSYMVYFRADQDACEIYRSDDNTISIKTNDPVIIDPDTWYDYKIVFNSQTGEITAYQNDVVVSSWTDPNPYLSGNSISLRTGNCIAEYDDLKVYKARITNEMAVLGQDVRFQNPDPQLPACRVKSIVRDSLLHFSDRENGNFNIDWTPPSDVMYVNDGLTQDVDSTHSASELSANWSASSDSNSGIVQYWYAIGTTPGADNVLAWTSNGLDTTLTASGFMNLQNGDIYYVSVKSENQAGLFSNVVTSDGQLAVLLPDVAFTASEVNICQGETISFYNGTQNGLSYLWSFPGADSESSVEENPSVTYNTPGFYSVGLIAQGEGGADSLLYTDYVQVYGNPVADFMAIQTEVEMPTAIVNFANNSNYADYYLWNFGDGGQSNDQNPYHVYSDTGYYDVQLIATNSHCGSDSVTIENCIHVIDPVGIFENSLQSEILIYPNPASEFVYVKLPEKIASSSVSLFDFTGKRLN